jgi:glycosyltransferase involved in cell wall biosynthesis
LELSKVLKSRGYNSVFVFSDIIEVQPIIDDLISESVIIEFITTKNKLTILRDIVKLFIKYKPAIVHAHFKNYIQLLTAVLSLIFGSRYFISFHTTISLLSLAEYRKKKGVLKIHLLKLYYRFLLFASKNVICISEAIKTQFCVFSGSDSAKIKCLYLGVNLQTNLKSKTQLRRLLSLPEDDFLLCNISAVEPIKGLEILIKAVDILKNKLNLKDFKFCHIGGLRVERTENILYRENLYKQVKELQLENEFLWLGHRNDISEILSAFDIYVHPSRMEGLPVAIMEACSQSLPVLGTRVGGIPEIIHHNINGYLISQESTEELAEILIKLIPNKQLQQRMGKESFKIFEERFNIKTQTKLLVDTYLILS